RSRYVRCCSSTAQSTLPRKSARSHSGRPVPGWCPLARLQYSFAEAWYRADHPHSQRIVFAPLAGTDPLQDRNRSHSPQGIFTQTSTPSTRRLMFVPLRPQLEQEKRPSRRSAHWSQKGQRTSTESHFRYWISWSASRKRSSGPPMALLLRSVRT